MKGRTINTEDLHNVVLQRKTEYGNLADVIYGIIEKMVAATPTTDRTNQDFIDRCAAGLKIQSGPHTPK